MEMPFGKHYGKDLRDVPVNDGRAAAGAETCSKAGCA